MEQTEIVENSNSSEEEELRLCCITSFILNSFCLKPEKWKNLIMKDNFRNEIFGWFNSTQDIILVFTMNSLGDVIPSKQLPKGTREKLVYFLKCKPIVIMAKNFRKDVIFGNISSQALKATTFCLKEIFMPLLLYTENIVKYPMPIAEEMGNRIKNLERFFKEVNKITCQRIILPLNTDLSDIAEIHRTNVILDLNMKNTLERMARAWTTQIEKILTDTIMDKENLLFTDEIQFWNKRYEDLYNIYEQLNSFPRKNILEILDSSNSVYSLTMHKTIAKVSLCLLEADDISLWLTPLKRRLFAIREISSASCKELFYPLVHTLYLIWINCKHYCKTKSLVVTLRSICNSLKLKIKEELTPSKYFHTEIDFGWKKVQQIISNIQYFRNLIEIYKKKLSSSKFPAWSFDSEKVFAQLKPTIEILKEFLQLFDTASTFQAMEKISFGGKYGLHLNKQTKNVHEIFRKRFRKWTLVKVEIEPGTAEFETFQKNLQIISNEVNDTDKKLSGIILRALSDCSDSSQINKITKIFFTRPTIKSTIQQFSSEFLKKYLQELHSLDKILDNISMNTNSTLYKSLPPMAGRIIAIRNIKSLTIGIAPYTLLSLIFTSSEIIKLSQEADSILEKVTKLQKQFENEWNETSEKIIEKSLNNKILIIDSISRHLEVNFNDKLYCILKEMKLIENTGILNGFESKENLILLNSKVLPQLNILNIFVDLYNQMIQISKNCVADLISDKMKKINSLFDTCLTLTWKNFDANLLNEILELTKDLLNRLRQTENNIEILMCTIKSWFHKDFYKNEDNIKGLVDFNDSKDFRHQIESSSKVKHLIENLLQENFNLFFNENIALLCKEKMDKISDQSWEGFNYLTKKQLNAFIAYSEQIHREIMQSIKNSSFG